MSAQSHNEKSPARYAGLSNLAPGSSTRRIKSVSELIRCFFIFNNKQKILVKGEKPAAFPANKAITQRDWKYSLRPQKEYPNSIKVGFRFAQYLKENPESSYDDLARLFGVSKPRVCQMVALYNRLPSRITEYLMNRDEPEILKYFTERKLRLLTILASDDDKLKKFDEMREAIL